MWSSGPAPHGHSSGNGCREQVRTRQPALEKRITVAWPMPRLAPVRSRVRRGVLAVFGMAVLQALGIRFLRSRIEPRLAPRLVGQLAAEFNAVVQPERPVVPELEAGGRYSPAAPARRPRHVADDVSGGDFGDRLLEGKAAFQRLRLLAGPGADLRLLRPGGEIGAGFFRRHSRHVAADADLTAQ